VTLTCSPQAQFTSHRTALPRRCVVSQARQDRERVTALRPALARPAAIAEAAAEQGEHLDVVARRRHVGIGGDDERRHLETADLVGEVEVLRQRLADLVQQPREVRGTWRDPLVQLVHRRVLHERGGGRAHLALLRAQLRIDRVRPDVRRGHDEPAGLGRVLRRCVERHPSAERVAHEVRPVQPEVVDECGDVVGHEPDVERSVDVGRAAVPLQVDGDDLVPLRQPGKERPEHLARPEPAVQQDQRPPGPMRLEVEGDAVDLGVLAVALRVAGPIGGHGLRQASERKVAPGRPVSWTLAA